MNFQAPGTSPSDRSTSQDERQKGFLTLALHMTRQAFLWTNILKTPFWAIYTMLPFILYKDLHASPLQIMAVITLKPLVSLFSTYWSAGIAKRRDRLLSNIIWAGILSHLPFFMFPFVDNPWFFVAASGFYMLLARGMVPAWMEILKLNIPDASRQRVFAWGSTFYYLGGGIFPFLFGWLMDDYFQIWRWIFPLTAFLSFFALFFQWRIPIRMAKEEVSAEKLPKQTFFGQLVNPWKSAWKLIQSRKDFGCFQIGFMLGGSGLMIMQPALPVFFVDVLELSYTELAVALTLCKGIGFALTSPLWAQWMHRTNIYSFCSVVTLLASLFPICLMGAPYHLAWLYLAYIIYGVMQAGSEMGWNLSGLAFARQEDSSLFTSVNVATVGLRGCVAPPLGSLLLLIFNSSLTLGVGCLLCLIAMLHMAYSGRKFNPNNLPDIA